MQIHRTLFAPEFCVFEAQFAAQLFLREFDHVSEVIESEIIAGLFCISHPRVSCQHGRRNTGSKLL